MKKLLALLALGAAVSRSSCNTALRFGRAQRRLGTGLGNKAHGQTFDGGQQQQDSGSLPTY